MTPNALANLLQQVASGDLTPAEAQEALAQLPFKELGHSTLDLHREVRQGIPEAVYGENKTPEQLTDILRQLASSHHRALATRVDEEKAAIVAKALPDVHHDRCARLLTLGEPPEAPTSPYAVVACAGTSDLPVASEAAATLTFLGHRVERLTDVGVAGVHRLFDKLELLRGAAVILSVAGMEGALTSVIGGLVSAPVIGVPTSVGYGVARDGHTALNAMLSSCASGVAVVNIDNGFGAAVFAHTILRSLPSKT
jgi:NCAIR mutase (PurE)-related protein